MMIRFKITSLMPSRYQKLCVQTFLAGSRGVLPTPCPSPAGCDSLSPSVCFKLHVHVSASSAGCCFGSVAGCSPCLRLRSPPGNPA